MKNISLSEIKNVLDESLNQFIEKKEYKNILFYGQEGFGRNSTIKNWIIENNNTINASYDLWPGSYHEEKNGILKKKTDKDGNYIYIFPDNDIKDLSIENSILFNRRFNYNDKEHIKPILDLLKTRKYTTIFNKTYELNNFGLFIATVFPNNVKYTYNFSESELELFDTYNVIPLLNEVIQYIINKINYKISYYENNPKDVDPDFPEYTFDADAKIEELQNVKKLAEKFIDIPGISFNSIFTPYKLELALDDSKGSFDKFMEYFTPYNISDSVSDTLSIFKKHI